MHNLPIRAAVFDMDGTLADTFPDILDQFNRILVRHGRPAIDFPTMVSLLGPTEAEILHGLLPHRPVGECESEIVAAMEAGAPIALFDGMREVLAAARDSGLRIGLYTGAGRGCGAARLRRMGLAGDVDAFLTGDDVTRSKPAPDGLLHMAGLLGVAPEHSVYIGDSHLDVQAARAAGMRALGVLWGVSDRARLAAEAPDAIAEAPAELLAWLRDRAGAE